MQQRYYTMFIDVSVFDPEALARQAAGVASDEGLSAEDWSELRQASGDPIAADIQMILDRGADAEGWQIDEASVQSNGDPNTCRTCGEEYPEGGDGWDGECPDCADASSPSYLNHYHCEACDIEWEDEWSCACNDKCPQCNREIEPYESDEVEREDG